MEKRQKDIHQAASDKYIYNLKERGAFVAGANWADKHPKCPWIDINVELPEAKKRVIFLCNNGNAYFGYNNIDNKSATVTNAPDGVKVTHWMPIPELS